MVSLLVPYFRAVRDFDLNSGRKYRGGIGFNQESSNGGGGGVADCSLITLNLLGYASLPAVPSPEGATKSRCKKKPAENNKKIAGSRLGSQSENR